MKKVVVGMSAFILIAVGLFFTVFVIETSPVSRNDVVTDFVVSKGATYLTISKDLKEENLIKSDFFYKMYVKMVKPKPIQAGIYRLSESMSVEDIVKTFENGSTYNQDVVTITIPEGKHLEEIAKIISEKTNHSKEEVLDKLNGADFINDVIEKYWFVTENVKQKGIRYSLEGYLFPDTYELLNKDVTIESIAYKMLDKMKIELDQYKDKIEKNEYNVHELLTLASIIEHEAILDEDRPKIASVFYNRLANNMKLQSCATIGYAIDEWKLTYSEKDMAVDSPYNTYYYSGLPVGPGNMPGLKSIEAAINPDETEYFYFLANVCDKNDNKTYYSKTYSEHIEKKKTYLKCVN